MAAARLVSTISAIPLTAPAGAALPVARWEKRHAVDRNFICECGHPLDRHAGAGCIAVVDENPPDKNLGDSDFCFCMQSPQKVVDAILDKALARHSIESVGTEPDLFSRGYNRAVWDIREALK